MSMHKSLVAVAIMLLMALASLARSQTAQEDSAQPRIAMREVPHAANTFSRAASLPPWASPIPSLPPDASKDALVMLYWESHFRVAREPVVLVHRAYQVNHHSALADIGQHHIQYHPEYQRLDLHAVRVIRAGARIDHTDHASVRFLQRERELESGVFTGAVTAAIVVDDMRVGDVLELSYSLTGQNPVFDGKFVEAAGWDAGVDVRLRRVKLDVTPGRTVRYRVMGARQSGDIHPEESNADGWQRLRFEGRNLPKLEVDNYTPRDIHPYRWIQLSEFTSWQDVAQWASTVFGVPARDPSLDAVISKLRAANSRSDAVVSALDFVQHEIRYLSLAFGENSHRPFPPKEVLARRYGDCKDKTQLLIAILQGLGIEASPVLVSLQHWKGLDMFLPSPAIFDHVIVRAVVDGRSYYLDPTMTSQASHLDKVAEIYAGAQGLVITARTAEISTIARTDATPATTVRQERVSVERMDGAATLSLQIEHLGRDAEITRANLARYPPEMLRKSYEGALHRRYPDAVLEEGPRVADDRRENRLAIHARYRLPKYLVGEQDRWLARFRADNLTQLFFIPDNARRQFALTVPSYPSTNRFEFEVALPAGMNVTRPSEQRTINSKAFTITESLSFGPRVAKLEIEIAVTADRIEASDTPAFLEDLRRYNEVLGGAIILAKADARARSPVAGTSLRQRVTAQLEEVVESTGRLIANPSAVRDNQADTLCERARALAYLGRFPEATSDIVEARRQQPVSAELLKCSGEVHFVAGNFASALPELNRAVALGQRDGDTYLLRGLTRYYLGQTHEAVTDFEQVSKVAKEAGMKLRGAIWHAAALRQLKASSPLVDNERVLPHWPAAVLNLLHNRSDPEDVLREAHKESGDRLEIALAEAYLHIGQHFALAGDRVRARVYFQRALEKGVLYALQHVSARHELAKIQ
jgi:transglutaminase-like putative cysteine protease/tetratricopeptide (TPR) repeat protein